MVLSIALKELRAELNMKQNELAAVLDLNVTTVNRWETGKTLPKRFVCDRLMKLAEDRGVSELCLFNLQEALYPRRNKEERKNDLRYTEIDRINEIVNESANGVVVIGLDDYSLFYANDKAIEFTGHQEEDIRHLKCYEFLRGIHAPCEDCIEKSSTGNEFIKCEFSSKKTGRHFVINTKLVTWKGRKAQIKYITDVTEMHELQRLVKKRQKALNYAADFVGMQVFEYNLKEDRAMLISHISGVGTEEQDLPSVTADAIKKYIVLPEYVALYESIIQEMRDGKKQSEIEIQVRQQGGKIHWVRFQMNLIEWDEKGNPWKAIGTALVIDREKMVASSRIL